VLSLLNNVILWAAPLSSGPAAPYYPFFSPSLP
jgi:hypothetical protein